MSAMPCRVFAGFPFLRLLVGTAACLPLAAPVAAEANWSPAAVVSDTRAEAPVVAISNRDDVLVAWEAPIPFMFQDGQSLSVGVSFRPRGRAFTPPRRVDVGRGARPAIAVGDGGEAVLAWERRASLTEPPSEVVAAMVGADGQVGLQRHFRGAGVDVAVDAAGNAIAVWSGPGGIHAAWRAPGAPAFGPAFLVAGTSGGASARVAFLERSALVVWSAGSAVYAAAAPPGRAFGGAQAISSYSGSHPGPLVLATNRRGDAVAVWRRGGGAGAQSPIAAAVRRPGGGFGGEQRLSPPGGMTGLPALALDPYGNAWAWWGNADPALSDNAYLARRERVFRRHPRPPSSVFGPPIPAEGLGADAAGNAIAVMPGRDLKSVVAFSRTPEGAFGAQLIAPPGAHQVLTGSVALNERGAGATVWSSGGNDDRAIRLSLYDGVAQLRRSLPRISRFRYARPRGRGGRPSFLVRSSKRVLVRIRVDAARRCGHRRRGPRRCTVASLERWVRQGTARLRLGRRTQRRLTRSGRYRATIAGEDVIGRPAKARSVRFRVTGRD